MAETVEDLKKKLTIWQDNTEAKGFRVNLKKNKTCMQETQFVSQLKSRKMAMQYLSQRYRQ